MINAQIKKPQGIEEIVGSYSPQTIEPTIRETHSHNHQELSKTYEITLNNPSDSRYSKIIYEYVKNNQITPNLINSFLQHTIKFEDHLGYTSHTGIFLSHLIEYSYDQGCNDFVLHTKNLKKLDYLGFLVHGSEERPLKITIKGDIGNRLATQARHVVLNVKGNTGKCCGSQARDCSILVRGNTDSECGSYAQGSKFFIEGDTKHSLARDSSDSIFFVKGQVDVECTDEFIKTKSSPIDLRANRSTFRTSNEKTLETFLKYVTPGNRIIYINKDGIEQIIRDYND